MLRKLLFVLFTVSYSITNAQAINAIVYDSEERVKGVKVLNITQKVLTVTNEQGEFTIKANPRDTLSFQSVFYKPIFVIVKEDYFEGTYVFELQKIINELEEVNIASKPKPVVFAKDKYNQSLNDIITKDKELRGVTANGASKYGVDFIRIAKMIGKLFKKKTQDIPNTLKYDQLKRLFETNPFFTQALLTNELKVPEQYHSLYYEFCETKNILESKLNYNTRLILLDDFTLYASEFMVIVEMAEEQAKDTKKN
ncbi:MAG: hypothetical protein ED556_06275 [Winogradskyella sp.]|uniref:hypothetical protein n=1 Tax=Winogradskyella sp. TaxID=1883156 RepID=UPI000F3D63FB|nr:hypothetical protein [Winogradskyella sp.]RNC87026.1 MAG: hypothetical protein ED556_06275 [Winogradskyella sp.]